MPVFRNLKSRRSSGKIPIEYDEHGWEKIPQIHPFDDDREDCGITPQSSSRSSSSTPPLTDTSASHRTRFKAKPRTRPTTDHIPRPRNAFIFFRSHFYKTAGGSDQNQVSVRAGKAWNDLSDEEREPFLLLAAKEKLDHQAKYPNYTYTPGRGSGKNRKASLRKKVMLSSTRVVTKPTALSPIILPSLRCASSSDCSPTPILSTPSPVATKGKPFLDLTLTVRTEPIFTPNWSFVPTSEIPLLELPPISPKTVKSEEVELPLLLQPPSLDDVADVFEPKCDPQPFVVSHLNYGYDELPSHFFLDDSQRAYEASLSNFDSSRATPDSEWTLSPSMDSLVLDLGSGPANDASSAPDAMDEDELILSCTLSYPPSVECPISRHEETVMNQYFDFDYDIAT